MSNRDINQMPSVKAIWKISIVLWYLGWVALGLLLIIIIGLSVMDKNVKYLTVPVKVTYENTDIIPFEDMNYHNEYPVVGFENLRLDINNEGGFDFSIFIPLFLISGYLWILKQIMIFIKTVKEGNPFVRENPKRIRRIGFFAMIAGPVLGLLEYIYGFRYLTYLDFPGGEVSIEPNVYPVAIFFGLVIFIIGYVYDLAVRIKEENDLTI